MFSLNGGQGRDSIRDIQEICLATAESGPAEGVGALNRSTREAVARTTLLERLHKSLSVKFNEE